MAWAALQLLLQLPCIWATVQRSQGQLRRTNLDLGTPHNAEWFQALSTHPVDEEMLPPRAPQQIFLKPSNAEYVRDCNLSLAVHATDFDDNFEGERVMNFMGNGRALGHDCYPAVNGCVSPESSELLYSCIYKEPVSTILNEDGKLKVSAQIPRNVDECPFHGNLLHGVTSVACYVGLLADLTTPTSTGTTTTTTTHWLSADSLEKYPDFVRKWLAEHPGQSIKDMPGYDSIYNMSSLNHKAEPVGFAPLPFRHNGSNGFNGLNGLNGGEEEELGGVLPAALVTTGALRCAEKGCKSNLVLDFNRTLVSLDRCLLQLWLNQTDFDNKDGAVEFVTIKVGGHEVLDKAKPGKNPLKDFDITEALRLGPVDISGEISKQVDECPSNGYLLDSSIEVNCRYSTIGALLERDQVSVADVMTLNKALLDSDIREQDETFKDFLKELRDAASVVEEGLIQPMKPKYCMCWFMELDDSPMSRWCLETAREARFLAKLHHRRFERMKAAHPWERAAQMTDVVVSSGLAFGIGIYSGIVEVLEFSACNKAVRRPMREVLPLLRSVYPGHVYVHGGYDGQRRLKSIERLAPNGDHWEALPPMSDRRAVVAADVELFVCGGWDGERRLSQVERYNITAGCWEQLPPMLERRSHPAVATLRGRLYVCGGFDGAESLSSVECFDPVSGKWSCLPRMRERAGQLNLAERYDPEDGKSWNLLPPHLLRRVVSAAAVIEGKLYVFGSEDDAQVVSSGERFDPKVDAWEALPPMLSRRVGAAAAAVAGCFYVCGGWDGRQRLASAERFNPSSGVWEALPPMNERRDRAAVATIADRLYVCGGFNGDSDLRIEFRFSFIAIVLLLNLCIDISFFSRSAECFDPASGAWLTLPPMQERRSSAVAVAALA
eukprot:g31306.t1